MSDFCDGDITGSSGIQDFGLQAQCSWPVPGVPGDQADLPEWRVIRIGVSRTSRIRSGYEHIALLEIRGSKNVIHRAGAGEGRKSRRNEIRIEFLSYRVRQGGELEPLGTPTSGVM
jgi:hypothetical protein